MTRQHCDFCQHPLTGTPYLPINTQRGMEVYACPSCGLLQSISTKAYPSRPPPNMSCDANRASIKYTKDIVNRAHYDLLQSHIDFTTVKHCADIGSNRGLMLSLWLENPSIQKITAVESDPELIKTYPQDSRLEAHGQRFEEVSLEHTAYDLIYCAHTLEHLTSARAGLEKIFDLLRPGASAFIAIPNLIHYNVDSAVEFFIDTHTFHFAPPVFYALAEAIGFEIQFTSTENEFGEIQAILKRPSEAPRNFQTPALDTPLHDGQAYLDNYYQELTAERAKIAQRVQALENILGSRKAVFWGAGRIFDSIFKVGQLSKDHIEVLVDKYLYRYLSDIQGCPVVDPKQLTPEQQRLPLIICSDAYYEAIQEEALDLGFTEIFHYKNFS